MELKSTLIITLYTKLEIAFEVIIEKLSADLIFLQSWFDENCMILNSKKCYFKCASVSQKLLGVITDQEWNFEEHIKTICQTAGKKLNALTKLTYLIAPYQLRLILNSLIKSHLNYCPLVWMFRFKRANNLVVHTIDCN